MNDIDDDVSCAVCGRPVLAAEGSDVLVELGRLESDDHLEAVFCSWAHAGEWFGRDEPEFETWEVYAPSRRDLWLDLLDDLRMAIFYLVLAALMGIGGWTVVGWIFR